MYDIYTIISIVKLKELSYSFIKDIDITPRIKQKAQVLGLCFYYEEG